MFYFSLNTKCRNKSLYTYSQISQSYTPPNLHTPTPTTLTTHNNDIPYLHKHEYVVHSPCLFCNICALKRFALVPSSISSYKKCHVIHVT